MKLAILALAVAVCCTGFLNGHEGSEPMQQQRAQSRHTLDNLATAMHGEAFAYAKYLLYAQHARKDGHERLARLLEETARTERFEHFAEEAKLAGLVGTDQQNLKDAIKGESYEAETMYRTFAEQADHDGDHAAAQRFREIAKDEEKHRSEFEAALSGLDRKIIPVSR